MSRLCQPFHIIGNQDRLAIVGWCDGVAVFNGCVLTTANLSYSPSYIDLTDSSGFQSRITGHTRVSAELSFEICRGVEMCDTIPEGLRFADDMTVRELLSAVNGKVSRRGVV